MVTASANYLIKNLSSTDKQHAAFIFWKLQCRLLKLSNRLREQNAKKPKA